MITAKDIVRAVNLRIKENFPEHPVKSTDFKKNVQPGSFYTEYPIPVFDGSRDFRHESGTVRVHYFPVNENNYRIELADMQQKLSMSFFSILQVNEMFAIPINEVSFDQSDGVLIMSFDYETWQEIEETGEDMQHIEIEEEVKNGLA